jgi:hypothetical protein
VAKNNPYIKCTPGTAISQDPDIQVLEISTPSIAPILFFNIYNEHKGSSNLYTIPKSFTKIPPPERCIIAGDMNAHHTWGIHKSKHPNAQMNLFRSWKRITFPSSMNRTFQRTITNMAREPLLLTLPLHHKPSTTQL